MKYTIYNNKNCLIGNNYLIINIKYYAIMLFFIIRVFVKNVCVCVCVYIYIYMCVCVCIYIYIYIYVCVCVCVFV